MIAGDLEAAPVFILKLLIKAEFWPYSPDFLDLDEIADERFPPRIPPIFASDFYVTTVIFFLVGF
jgi:hypothetical protein